MLGDAAWGVKILHGSSACLHAVCSLGAGVDCVAGRLGILAAAHDA